MNSTLHRIKQYIDNKGISIHAFEKSVGFSNGAFSSQLRNNRTIGIDKLENILKKYADINVEWLLTGKGEMLKGVYPEQSGFSQVNEHNPNEKVISTDSDLPVILKRLVESQDEMIKILKNQISDLQSDNKALKSQVKELKAVK